MKKSLYPLILALILAALSLGACNLGANTPTLSPDLALTQAAETIQALFTSPAPTATLAPLVVEDTPAVPIAATATPGEAATATPTQTQTPTATASPTQGDCTNQIDFIDDLSVPDDTAFLPGQTFTKTWRLRNVGTCTWTSSYALVFVDGEALNATSPVALPASVPPQSDVDLSVTMTAPGVPGTYTSNWMLRSPGGVNFGLGDAGSRPFWARIVVQEGTTELNLGSPDWRDTLDASTYWYLVETSSTRFTVEDGKLQMTVLDPGSSDEWGLSQRPEADNFYLQATFITGGTCADADRYGVLLRSPDPSQGYVFGFSCSGRYRLYSWDGETYRGIQEWRASSAIRAGANQTNLLGVWMDGETIRLYANGQLLAEFTDDQFDAGKFGLFIGSPDTTNFTVYVDEVATWDLND
jgi:hypothetical protein